MDSEIRARDKGVGKYGEVALARLTLEQRGKLTVVILHNDTKKKNTCTLYTRNRLATLRDYA